MVSRDTYHFKSSRVFFLSQISFFSILQFRTLTTKLSVPSSLSAAASLRTLSAMKIAADYSSNNSHLASEVFRKSCKPASSSPSSSSLQHEGVRAHEASVTLFRALGNFEKVDNLSSQPLSRCTNQLSAEQVERIVAGLHQTADRLQQCFYSAQTLRRSLHALKEEEIITKTALRDYDQQPARRL